jgi:hypothetical protein
VRDWRITLVEAHPRLFRSRAGKLTSSGGYPRCGGWRNLLERAFQRIGDLALPTWALTLDDLRQEPRSTNSRLVWPYSENPVPLELLSEHHSIRLEPLLQQVEGGFRGSRSVMAMACANLIDIDLASQSLGPTTIAELRVPRKSSVTRS